MCESGVLAAYRAFFHTIYTRPNSRQHSKTRTLRPISRAAALDRACARAAFISLIDPPLLDDYCRRGPVQVRLDGVLEVFEGVRDLAPANRSGTQALVGNRAQVARARAVASSPPLLCTQTCKPIQLMGAHDVGAYFEFHSEANAAVTSRREDQQVRHALGQPHLDHLLPSPGFARQSSSIHWSAAQQTMVLIQPFEARDLKLCFRITVPLAHVASLLLGDASGSSFGQRHGPRARLGRAGRSTHVCVCETSDDANDARNDGSQS